MRSLWVLGLTGMFLSFPGCGDENQGHPQPGPGETCSGAFSCMLGYLCSSDGVCVERGQPGAYEQGDACASTHDCRMDLVCSSQGRCVLPGSGGEGDVCVGPEDCGADLVCSSDGRCRGQGEPGTGDVADACSGAMDCQMGLACMPDGACAAVQWWDGIDCSASDTDDGPARAYFEVPRQGEPLVEFYRLPFPNDIRFHDGHLDLTGHPAPQSDAAGDLLQRYLTLIEQTARGFSPNQAFLFRFSVPLDFDTLQLGDDPTLYIVDITPQSRSYGSGGNISVFTTSGRGRSICQNWLSVRPQAGWPLQPGDTYAVILTKGLKGLKDGVSVELSRDADFDALMTAYQNGTAPDDTDLAAAFRAYQPLWDALDDATNVPLPTPPEQILSAAVFTLFRPRTMVERLRQAVREDPAVPTPTMQTIALCGDADPEPCEPPSDRYHQFLAQVGFPVFQSGTRPYATQDDGGAVKWDLDGNPVVQGAEDVDVVLTVPKDLPMPEEGWPVVIFAHDTGGSRLSFIHNGVAELLSHVTLDGTDLGFVVISYNEVEHGSRRGGSDEAPEVLFFNPLNPLSALGNSLQGAADLFQMVRLVENLDMDIPGFGPLRLDPSRIYFYGHGQGSDVGAPAAAFEPDIRAVVLSGAGAHMMTSLLFKRRPMDLHGLMEVALMDSQLNLDHPWLNLFQLYFDPIDPVNFGHVLGRWAPQQGRDLLQIYGLGDSFSPEQTMAAMARSLGLEVMAPVLVSIEGVSEYDGAYPLSGNAVVAGDRHTLVLLQTDPQGAYDGHDVAQQDPATAGQIARFFASAALYGLAQVPARSAR